MKAPALPAVIFTFATISTLLPEVLGILCAPPFLKLEQGCYYFSKGSEKETFFQAKERCLALGANLTSLESPIETETMRIFLANNKLATDSYLIGAYDFGHNEKWYWLSTTAPIIWFNWAPGEPNNKKDEGEHCILLNGRNQFLWIDDTCSTIAYNYICEIGLSRSMGIGIQLTFADDNYY